MTPTETKLFQEFLRVHKQWSEAVSKQLRQQSSASSNEATSAAAQLIHVDIAERIASQALAHCIDGVLAVFDGITELSDHGVQLSITDQDGSRLSSDLHYLFSGVLIDNNII